MRKFVCLFLASAAMLLADVSGKWRGPAKGAASDGDTQTLTVTFDLTQSGNDVTGTVSTNQGDQFRISKGAMDGNTLTIDIQGGEHGTYHAVMTVDGDTMTGEAKGGGGDNTVSVKLELKRQS